MVDTDTLRSLLATLPSEFVARRTEVAEQLRADGDRDGAAAVKALRRLGVADWALNVAAGEDPEAAAGFADAADAVLDAQEEAMAGRGGADLRERLAELRSRTAHLVAAAHAVAERHGQRGSGSSTIDLAARLAEIGANRAAADLLRNGLLGAADPGVADPFGVVADGGERPPRTARTAGTSRRGRAAPTDERHDADADEDDDGGGDRGGELERRRAARRARAEAEAAVQEAAAELAAAEAALDTAAAAEAKAVARVADAERALADAVAARDDTAAARAAAEAARERAAAASEAALAALAALD